ncbi:hypothetical protein MCOR27_010131 [Pyricularia oryzae]|uniref:RING-CH-type domain-containing protein n=1 Tax=Pyricularia grisea TaxID=148305 RepID=A0ABQ8NEH8_PYRGI|nr:hypothetical protein MCOR01_008933 [Pyricularia oryzae]KAI6295747.1 hypothetical protein MCOR33_007421 [Pyricularia grisea]KAH9439617.1 hypothetical protein MCOR02_003158 [Pyricularia oryzae]KAI6258651.1 hypothetical protein MCOR19_004948 [Pyricularia oryzae]KAI6268515.1 hypothetical protein MCOR27_010131 [Pyricularia oryzae]
MDSQRQFNPQQDWSWGETSGSTTSASESVDQSGGNGTRHRPSQNAPKPANVGSSEPTPESPNTGSHPGTQQQQRRDRYYRPRTCRICLDTVNPTFEMDTSATAAVFGARPRVKYVSDDPELGRLISPCKCKGSQRYVHEGCLQAWRQAAPLNDRNFWSCPTCKFQYRMDRLQWSAWLSSRLARAVLTLLVAFITVFIMGFVADPIINLWVDPWGTFMDAVGEVVDDFDDFRGNLPDQESYTWSLHFVKGIMSLGLLGAVKTVLAMSPWQWWHFRNGGMLGNAGNRRGRDRMESVNLALVMVGLFTFLVATWKVISVLSSRVLEKVSEKVADIHGDEDDDDDDYQDDAGHDT